MPPKTPPLPNPGDAWYYQLMGETYGPVTREELQSLAGNGTIQTDTPVRSSVGDWRSADRVVLFPQRASTSESKRTDPDDPFSDAPNSTPRASPHIKKKRNPQIEEDRFPNLNMYLLALEFWVALVFQLIQWATICLYVLGMAFLLAAGMHSINLTSIVETSISFAGMVFLMIILTISGAIIVVLNLAARVISMAGIEFVRVQVAIEKNTRQLLNQ